MQSLRPLLIRHVPRDASALIASGWSRSICYACHSGTQTNRSTAHFQDSSQWQYRINRTRPSRTFSSSLRRMEAKEPSHVVNKPPRTADPVVNRVPDEELPSHWEKQKWELQKRFNAAMDEALKQMAIAGQRLNTYTGTDYSGVEALRREIKEQEQLVKARHQSLLESKAALDAAHVQRSTSSSELVALLERKHSWSNTDLERYMSLIRSEHANDQAVAAAKEGVANAEQALEEARTRLEKRERAQYHEEQIWSDTIRRNSTWVTIGLMGLNIGLLLANVVIIEPWRRRRLVREMKKAVEDNAAIPAVAGAIFATPSVVESTTESQSSAAKDEESRSESNPSMQKAVQDEVFEIIDEPPLVDSHSVETIAAEEHPRQEEELPVPTTPAELVPEVFHPWTIESTKAYLKYLIGESKTYLNGLFSEQPIVVRQVEITTVAMQAASVGIALTTLLVLIIRPR